MGSQRCVFTVSGRSVADPDIDLIIRPGTVMTPEEFCGLDGPAIGLDGAVSGAPFRRPGGPHASYNHHESVDRYSTRSTCEQCYLDVSQGLWLRMHRGGHPGADVYVNDADEDVCTALWVLANPRRINELAVRRLVEVEGILDVLAATWWPEWAEIDDMLAHLAWVYGPCHDARRDAQPADEESLRAIIEEVAERITAHVNGSGGRRAASTEYVPVLQRGAVAVVREYGPYARMQERLDGLETVISERWAGTVRIVSITKTTPWSSTDLATVYRRLNELEGCPPDDQWGGSDLVGGSPRRRGTSLSLETILDVVASSGP
ncbi:MAG: hypothetical protein ACRD2W_02255 [Acidimicrobiales bacterium]